MIRHFEIEAVAVDENGARQKVVLRLEPVCQQRRDGKGAGGAVFTRERSVGDYCAQLPDDALEDGVVRFDGWTSGGLTFSFEADGTFGAEEEGSDACAVCAAEKTP